MTDQRAALGRGFVLRPVKEQLLAVPEKCRRCAGPQNQRNREHPQHEGSLKERRAHLRRIHLRDQKPGGIRNPPHRGEHRYSPIIHALHPAFFTFCGTDRGSVAPAHGNPEFQRRVLAVTYIAQVQHTVTVPPHQQRLRAFTGHRPRLEERIQVGVRIEGQK